MVNLISTIGQLRCSKILVAGDFILDSYTVGKVSRISPEAPVPVLRVSKEEHRPGGAGNVCVNLCSLAAEVTALGRIGDDLSGSLLKEILTKEGVNTEAIVLDNLFVTPVKNRIMADNQQMIRVDRERTDLLPHALEQYILALLPKLLSGIELVAISDYGKGFFTPTLLKALISMAREQNIPLLADPKGEDFAKYRGVNVIKPNFSEALVASGLSSCRALHEIGERVLEVTEADIAMITRSEEGISLFYRGGLQKDFPVEGKEVRDVTGAGDTVLATLACALASGLTIEHSTELANLAASIAVERVGCARISIRDISERALEKNVANKIFSEESLFALQQVLKGKRVAVLKIGSYRDISPQTFALMHRLYGKKVSLLIYLQNANPDPQFIEMLTSLQEVGFIILQKESLEHLCRFIRPDEVFIAEEGEIKTLPHSNELVTFSPH